MALQYRFKNSSPVLAELSRDLRLPNVPPNVLQSVENVDSLEYIDKSLGLLGHFQRAQDDRLRLEFDHQRKFMSEKFKNIDDENGSRNSLIDQRLILVDQKFTQIKEQLERFKEEVGQRFEEVGQRFEEVGQRFEEVGQRFEEVGQRFEEVGQRFDQMETRFNEMDARMFNSLSYRAHHEIHPVALFDKGRGLQRPDPKHFPKTIKHFWRLQSSQNASRRFYLLRFYRIEGYQQWKENDEVDSDSSASSTGTLTLELAVRAYPQRCLEALAARLGLQYDKISDQMERQSQPLPPAQPPKRGPRDMVAEQESGQPSKKLLVRSRSIDFRHSEESEAEQEEHGSTDIVPETVDLARRPREGKQPSKNPSKGRTSQREERSHGSTETMSSSEYRRIAGRFL